MEWFYFLFYKKKPLIKTCKICFCEKRLSCVHLCNECMYIIKKYYPYDECPYCLDIFEPRVMLLKNPIDTS